MSEDDFKKLMSRFESIGRECDTPEKATALLQREGLVDGNGEIAERFREAEMSDTVCL